jgi:hypothetical protein
LNLKCDIPVSKQIALDFNLYRYSKAADMATPPQDGPNAPAPPLRTPADAARPTDQPVAGAPPPLPPQRWGAVHVESS